MTGEVIDAGADDGASGASITDSRARNAPKSDDETALLGEGRLAASWTEPVVPCVVGGRAVLNGGLIEVGGLGGRRTVHRCKHSRSRGLLVVGMRDGDAKGVRSEIKGGRAVVVEEMAVEEKVNVHAPAVVASVVVCPDQNVGDITGAIVRQIRHNSWVQARPSSLAVRTP